MKRKIRELLNRYRIERDALLIISVSLAVIVISMTLAFFESNRDNSPGRDNFTITYREDFRVAFEQEVLDEFRREYSPAGKEYMFCLTGNQEADVIRVTGVEEEELLDQTPDHIIYLSDPPCRKPGSIGSIHSHKRDSGCAPSDNDIFTFGEMTDPEPIINIIQCDTDKFFIMKMPGKNQPIDFRSLRWSVE